MDAKNEIENLLNHVKSIDFVKDESAKELKNIVEKTLHLMDEHDGFGHYRGDFTNYQKWCGQYNAENYPKNFNKIKDDVLHSLKSIYMIL